MENGSNMEQQGRENTHLIPSQAEGLKKVVGLPFPEMMAKLFGPTFPLKTTANAV